MIMDAEAIYLAHKAIFGSQTNVGRVIIDALIFAMPREYKRSNTINQIGAKIYKVNSDPQVILNALRYNYRKVQPSKKTRMMRCLMRHRLQAVQSKHSTIDFRSASSSP